MNELRELLRERAEDFKAPPRIPLPVLRQARRRRVVNGALAGLLATGLAIAGIAGIQAITRPQPVTPVTQAPVEWRGMWPFATQKQAEVAQAEVDEGGQQWLLNPKAVVRAFAREQFGWDQAFLGAEPSVEEAEGPGALVFQVMTCDRVLHPHCSGDTVTVTVERLVRADPSGIWLVTEFRGPMRLKVPHSPGPATP